MKSVRLRLLILALLPLVVLMPVLLGYTMVRWAKEFDELLIAKVASDLRIAEQYMQRLLDNQGNETAALAGSVAYRNAAARGSDALTQFLEVSRKRLGLDYLALRDVNSAPVLVSEKLVTDRAVRMGTGTSISIYSAKDLTSISPDLAKRAQLSLVETQAARPITRDAEDRGMVMVAATRIEAGKEGKVLVGGRLLNQNLDFIDTINELVYSGSGFEGGRTGTATLFLDDVRISTNVRLFEDVRALGTRVSEVVWTSVMQNGDTWLDRAFVVNNWYISGYLPITDAGGSRIGMLYVGFLEQPFTTLKQTTIVALLLAFVIVLALTVPIFLRLARGIFTPLEHMSSTMKRVEAGDIKARIDPVRAKDEISQVARNLNDLLDQVQERDAKLRDWAEDLNVKVDERTEELREANRRLESTFEQLVMSEKLASIGEIAAGVAHEINNPVAIIQGNLEVLKQTLGNRAKDVETEISLIDTQAHRINVIVSKLLKFARASDFADTSEEVDVTTVVHDCLVLVQADLNNNDIELNCEFEPAPLVKIVEIELQQVLINLLINAIQAMPEGGSIHICVAPAQRNAKTGTEVIIADTGAGISMDQIAHVFDPFHTTKPTEGTGLGLSISQTLIQRAGGLISVRSEVGHGSRFSVWLPAIDKLSEANA